MSPKLLLVRAVRGREAGVLSADHPSPSHHPTTDTHHSPPRCGPSYNQRGSALLSSDLSSCRGEVVLAKLSSQSCLLWRVDIARGRAGTVDREDREAAPLTSLFTRTKPAPTFLYHAHKSDSGNCMTGPYHRRPDNGGNIKWSCTISFLLVYK